MPTISVIFQFVQEMLFIRNYTADDQLSYSFYHHIQRAKMCHDNKLGTCEPLDPGEYVCVCLCALKVIVMSALTQ